MAKPSKIENMSIKIMEMDYTRCTGCGACVSTCPQKALSLQYNEEGFYHPFLNAELCVNCGACDKVCHALHNEQPIAPSRNYTAYMVKSKDASIVAKSSSGGAFSLLADNVIKQRGVVWGARYNYDKERLEHCSTDECPLDDLRKSKYIESYMGNSFTKVRQQLKEGRKVMFVGTPCQVEGLHTFLAVRKVDTTNLLLVRFVCHGVPSNKFFTEYKRYEEEKRGSKMIRFDFRPKTRGWRNSDWQMWFENGYEEHKPYYYYYYYYYFQLNNLLRSSCYHCHRVFHEIADITIADFWGIHSFRPENRDQEGISVALVHSSKGKDAIKAIKNNCNMEEIPASAIDYIFDEATSRQDNSIKRIKTMQQVKKKGYMYVAKKELRYPMLKMRLKDLLKSIIKR